MRPLGSRGGFLEHLFGLLGPLEASWGRLEASWGGRLRFSVRVPPLGPLLGPCLGPLGSSWAPLGPSRGPLGPSWGALWGLLGRLETVLGASWTVLERRGDEKARTLKAFTNLKEINDLCLLGLSWDVLEASWAVLEPSWAESGSSEDWAKDLRTRPFVPRGTVADPVSNSENCFAATRSARQRVLRRRTKEKNRRVQQSAQCRKRRP